MAGYDREAAKPLFTQEIREIEHGEKDGDDQFAKMMFDLPLGEKANRVVVIGTLTETEDIGTDTEYWKGRVVDPTGSILIYAGEFQPEAAQLLSEIETPAYVAVIGKPNIYKTDNGLVVSVRPESVTVVSDEEREIWVQEASRYALHRLKEMEDSGVKKTYAAMIVAALQSLDE